MRRPGRTRLFPATLGVVAPALALLLAAPAALTQQAVVIDGGTTHQTVRGWEATAWAGDDETIPPTAQHAALDSIAASTGLDRVRLEIRAGVENDTAWWSLYRAGVVDYATWRANRYATVNDDDDPDHIEWSGFHFDEMDTAIVRLVDPLREKLAARGVTLWVNLNYVAFTGQNGPGTEYIHDDPAEYAEFVLATFLHLQQNFGWVPDSWEVILEPDNVAQWNGTLIGEALVAVAAKLADHGFAPEFVAPSNTSMAGAVTTFDQLVAVPGAGGLVDELCYHRYAGVSGANLAALAERARARGIATGMLEWWSSSNGYRVQHEDLRDGHCGAWQQGVLAGPYTGGAGMALYWYDVSDPDDPVPFLNEKTRLIRVTWRNVRRGAVRIGAQGGGSFSPLAFVNPDGTWAVVIQADAGGEIAIAGLPAGTYGGEYALEAGGSGPLPAATIGPGEDLLVTVPGRGALAVRGEEDAVAVLDPGDVSGAPPSPLSDVAAWPNPFNARLRVAFTLARAAQARLTICDLRGRVVRTLVATRLAAGRHVRVWDGCDATGRPVASGCYEARIAAAGRVGARPVMLVK
jgi:hypothetical protein